MTRPYERWNTLWQLFIALDLDWPDEWPSEEAAVEAATGGWTADDLSLALAEWHEAFDDATDAELEDIVSDFNPMYDPSDTFGTYRSWAGWVRDYLERELAARL